MAGFIAFGGFGDREWATSWVWSETIGYRDIRSKT